MPNNPEMTEQQIAIGKGNKLICRYVGFKESKTNVFEVPNCWPDGPKTGYTECTVWNVGFDRDWNMLMPVVEKISKMPLIGADSLQDTCYPRTFGMLNPETGHPMVRFNACFLHEAPTIIEATWLAVVDFAERETGRQGDGEPSLEKAAHGGSNPPRST